jgi:hypothetical protein
MACYRELIWNFFHKEKEQTVTQLVENTTEKPIQFITLPKIKRKFDIQVTIDDFLITVSIDNELFSLLVSQIEEFKRCAMLSIRSFSEWIDYLKKESCMDGFLKEVCSMLRMRFILFYSDGKPKLKIQQGFDIVEFDSVEEALVCFTKVVENINEKHQQFKVFKNVAQKNEVFLDKCINLIKTKL